MALIMMEHLFTRIHWCRVRNRRRPLHEVPATPPEKGSKKREKSKKKKTREKSVNEWLNALVVEATSGKYQTL
jgi:hypothetical protein